MAKRIIRYFGALDLLTQKHFVQDKGIQVTARHRTYVYASRGLPMFFDKKDEIVEVYGIDRDLTHVGNDGKTPVVLLEVYVAGKKLSDDEVAKYNEEYGYYAEGHCNKEASYLIIKDRWLSYHDYLQKEYDQKLPDIHERYAKEYFDNKTIKAPYTVYDYGSDLGSRNIFFDNRFNEIISLGLRDGIFLSYYEAEKLNKLTGWKTSLHFDINPYNELRHEWVTPQDIEVMERGKSIYNFGQFLRSQLELWEKFANMDDIQGIEAAKQYIEDYVNNHNKSKTTDTTAADDTTDDVEPNA